MKGKQLEFAFSDNSVRFSDGWATCFEKSTKGTNTTIDKPSKVKGKVGFSDKETWWPCPPLKVQTSGTFLLTKHRKTKPSFCKAVLRVFLMPVAALYHALLLPSCVIIAFSLLVWDVLIKLYYTVL